MLEGKSYGGGGAGVFTAIVAGRGGRGIVCASPEKIKAPTNCRNQCGDENDIARSHRERDMFM